MHPAQASPSELIVSSSSAAARRPSVRSPPKRRLTCPRVRTPPRPRRGAHLTRVSALSGLGSCPYPASYPAPLAEEPAITVPVSCCLSAAGIGLPGHPVPARGLGLPHGRLTGRDLRARTRTGFPRSALRDTTGMGASSTPGTAVLSRPDAVPGQRLPLPSGQSLHPAPAPHRGVALHEAATEVHAIHPPGLPLACSPRMGQGTLGLSPVLRTPPLPATHDRAGPGMSTCPELRDRHNRPSNPRVHSLSATSCRNGT